MTSRATLALVAAALLVPALAAQYVPATPLVVGPGPQASVTGDWDGDLDPDLAVSGGSPDKIVLLFNDGTGALGAAVSVLTGAGTAPHTPVAADFDDDDDLDIAVTLPGVGRVGLLVNDGTGSFSVGLSTIVGAGPQALVATRLNNDFLPDIAVVNTASNSISVLLNQGAGAFTVTDVGVGVAPLGLAATDLNGDGDVDLAVTITSARRVDVLRNDGNGTLAMAASLFLGQMLVPGGVALADFDADGDADIAAAGSNASSHQVRVWRNQNGFNFSGPAGFAVGGLAPAGIAIADVDLDFDFDLVTANVDSDDISVLRNNGNAIFAAAAVQVAEDQPRHLVAADLDANGSPEILATNTGTNTVSLLLNQNEADAFKNLGKGLPGIGGAVPQLIPDGTLVASTPVSLSLGNARPNAPAALVLGLSVANLAFKGGTLVPLPLFVVALVTDATGGIALSATWPGTPSGTVTVYQFLVDDTAAEQNFALSNAVQGTAP